MVWNTVSVAKAGITATLQCRTSVLGAANPKYGRFDENEPLANQINMPPALLSRFDLIFALLDKPNQEKDAKIAEHIIKGHTRGQVLRQGEGARTRTSITRRSWRRPRTSSPTSSRSSCAST